MAENSHENAGVSRVNDSEGSGGSDESKKKKSSSTTETEKKTKKESKADGGDKADDSGGDKKKQGDKNVADKAVEKETEILEQKKAMMKKLHAIHMSAQVAGGGVRFMIMAKLLNMMKMMAQMAMCVIQGAMQMGLGSFMMMCLQAAAQAIVNGLVALAGWIGTTVSTVAAGIVAGIVAVAVAVGSMVTSGLNTTAQRDWVEPCNTDSSFMKAAMGELTADQLETAKQVYALFKAYGLADTNIAGILGNWESESSLDPTAVETIYSEPRLIPAPGMKKYEAWQGSYDYPTGPGTWSSASPANFMLKFNGDMPYGKFGLRTYNGTILDKSLLESYSDSHPGIYYMGIGLGQWTNGRNVQLRAYADMHDGYEWYDVELQLMFAIDPSGDGDYLTYVNMLAGWDDEPTPSAAADWFCDHWEGISSASYGAPRRAQAEVWYNHITSWVEGVDYDLTAAQAIIASVSASATGGGNRSGVSSLRSCSGYKLEANDSAADAAVSFAWGPGEAYDNDGTDCWKQLFGTIVGDSYYRCCDRTVAVAIKWSGTDSDYPNGSTADQLTYLITSPRWQKIEWGGNKDNLLPGDVLIRNDNVSGKPAGWTGDPVGHTLMYVGVDAMVKRFGENYNGHNVRSEGYCLVSGSYLQYSPHVSTWYCSSNKGANDLTTYSVFRNVQKYSNRSDWTSLSCVGGTPAAS